eukprot:12205468-Karenia_brevis.AAC.1
MAENVEEIHMDLPPSPVEREEGSDAVGPPWPTSVDSSFLVLPSKGNGKEGKAPGPSGPQNPFNM